MGQGVCQLCGQTKTLIKAHIIPRSFFHQLKGNAKSLLGAINRQENPVEFSQSGYSDLNILCNECEVKFGPWDRYGFELLSTPPGNNGPVLTDADLQPFLFKNIDYEKLKLFVLGVLWRASATKHKFFDGIKLGPHQERIGKLLLAGQPGAAEEYPTIIGRLIGQRHEKLVFAPRTSKMRGIRFCIFYLPFLKVIVKVDSQPLPSRLWPFVLNGKGQNIALPMKLDGAEFAYLDVAKQIFTHWQPKRPPK